MKHKFLVMPHVWLHMLSSKTSPLDPLALKLKRLLTGSDKVIITGPIIQEILSQVTGEHDKLKALFEGLEYIEITKEDYYQAGIKLGSDQLQNIHEVVAARLGAVIVE